jgi:hypothetical protein
MLSEAYDRVLRMHAYEIVRVAHRIEKSEGVPAARVLDEFLKKITEELKND